MFGQIRAQSADEYVKKIEKLKVHKKLSTKTSTDKTFAGSVTAYYDQDSLVLISSLTDAEAAGTETLYFFKDGVVLKVFIMAAILNSHDEWAGYYFKHQSVDRCYTCHGAQNCTVTEITLGNNPAVVMTEMNRQKKLTKDEVDKILIESKKLSEELKTISKELK